MVVRTLIVLLSMALSACGVSLDDAGSDTAAPTPTPSSAAPAPDPIDDPVCGPLRRVRHTNTHLARLAQREPEWARLQSAFESRARPLLSAYDQAIVRAPPAAAADLRTMRAFDEAGLRSMRDSSDVHDFLRRLHASASPDAANAATVRVDRFAESTCGFAVQSG